MKLHRVSLIIFYDSRKRILLQDRRGISKVGEHWAYFGGHINEDETPEQALLRETKEELGFELIGYDYKFLDKFTEQKNQNRNFMVDRWVYVAPMPPLSELKLGEGNGMKLFTLKQAMKLKMVSEGDKDVIRKLEEMLK
ncbi:MAG: NUDIX domain-containing protein [DPANN group archaeon]|nr:NUDIX domain-containing protein [DPANN group archaeon]